jgi:hypothetical protein
MSDAANWREMKDAHGRTCNPFVSDFQRSFLPNLFVICVTGLTRFLLVSYYLNSVTQHTQVDLRIPAAPVLSISIQVCVALCYSQPAFEQWEIPASWQQPQQLPYNNYQSANALPRQHNVLPQPYAQPQQPYAQPQQPYAQPQQPYAQPQQPYAQPQQPYAQPYNAAVQPVQVSFISYPRPHHPHALRRSIINRKA